MNSIRIQSDGPPWWLPDTFKAPKIWANSKVSRVHRKVSGKSFNVYNYGLAGRYSLPVMCLLIGVLSICSSGPLNAHSKHTRSGMAMSCSYKAINKNQAHFFVWKVDYGFFEQNRSFADTGPPRPGGAVRHGPWLCPELISPASRYGYFKPLIL